MRGGVITIGAHGYATLQWDYSNRNDDSNINDPPACGFNLRISKALAIGTPIDTLFNDFWFKPWTRESVS